jgi:hypothetical protein
MKSNSLLVWVFTLSNHGFCVVFSHTSPTGLQAGRFCGIEGYMMTSGVF